MGRRTIKVAELIERINWQLQSPVLSREVKSAIASTLETTLHVTGNYNGFNYNFDWTNADEKTRKAREYDRFYYINPFLSDDVAELKKARETNGGFANPLPS